MTYDDLLERTRALAGFESIEQAERAMRATLSVVGEGLVEDERRALAAALPEPAARALGERPYAGAIERAELYERVARREGAEIGFALEHAQSVLLAVGEAIPAALRARLEAHLGDVAGLLEPRPASSAPPPRLHADHTEPPPQPGNLATGRPGSRHPISEARGRPAHSQSVVRSSDPHADTKLSSSRGLTQERLRETLAEGKPKTRRDGS